MTFVKDSGSGTGVPPVSDDARHGETPMPQVPHTQPPAPSPTAKPMSSSVSISWKPPGRLIRAEQFRVAHKDRTAAVLNLHKQPTVLTLLGKSDFDPDGLRDEIYEHCRQDLCRTPRIFPSSASRDSAASNSSTS